MPPMGFLKSRNFLLFLQGVVYAALKMLAIHKGFLRFLPCNPSRLTKNLCISLFSETPWLCTSLYAIFRRLQRAFCENQHNTQIHYAAKGINCVNVTAGALLLPLRRFDIMGKLEKYARKKGVDKRKKRSILPSRKQRRFEL